MKITPTNKPQFSSDWAPQIRTAWPQYVFPLLEREKPLRWLEIGSFEGRSALWTVENMFKNSASEITCVDMWLPWGEYGQLKDYNYELVFDANTAGVSQITKRKGPSKEVLPSLVGRLYHGCYIDGSHDEEDVLEDAQLVLPLVAPGGVIIFDDYEWPHGQGVRRAVDALIAKWSSVAKVVWMGYQAILQVSS